jgi:ribosomal protein S18 acetylase RimI-like enzyme
MADVRIRMMEAADLQVVLEIQAACYTEVTPESRESFHAKLGASESTCFVATLGDDTVGYLIALPWEFASPPVLDARTCRLPSSPDCLYLHDLAVKPAARKSGAGRALVEAFLVRLKGSDLGRASLVAVQDSWRYWERHGFRPVQPTAPLKAKLATYGEGVRYMERAGRASATALPGGLRATPGVR